MRKVARITEGRKRKPKERERITPEALAELIRRNAVCVHDQEMRCPLVLFTQVMAWELNVFFGVGDETDKGFKRHSDVCAARPLTKERVDKED